MRIGVHDFAGHPFQVQLSRELAASGHSVRHWYLRDLPGPKGALQPCAQDPPGFRCSPISLGAKFEKYSMIKRHFLHRRYAAMLVEQIRTFRPDVVLSANAPIDVQHHLLAACRRNGAAFVHWMQDIYCKAIRSLLTRKLGRFGDLLAFYYDNLERDVCELSDGVVFITPDFAAAIARMGFHPVKSHVIENWAPLDEVALTSKRNPWSLAHGFVDKLVFLYAGTLGLKHKPELLYHLAASLESAGSLVVVVSEGLGRSQLEQMQHRSRLSNLRLMDFQSYSDLPDMLGAADVLLSIIEDKAGSFAVPSKVLSYLCAGRPVLLAAPQSNLASRTIARAEAGIVVPPGDAGELIHAANRLAADAKMRRLFAENARRYAISAFDIHAITQRFESILAEAVQNRLPQPRAQEYTHAFPSVAAD